jgi:hypothetical protein
MTVINTSNAIYAISMPEYLVSGNHNPVMGFASESEHDSAFASPTTSSYRYYQVRDKNNYCEK